MINKLIGATFFAAALSSTAMAADIKPALVYGTGGRFDKSFNEAAYTGAEKFKAETGIDYRDFEPTGDTQGEQALGIKEDGVSWAYDDNNKPLITPEILAAVEKAKTDIVSGAVKVHDYMTDNSCPK